MRLIFNLLAVWTLTGIWHGAAWNFLLWGGYFALLLIFEKLVIGKALERLPRLLRFVYSLFFIFLGWLIFAADGTVAACRKGKKPCRVFAEKETCTWRNCKFKFVTFSFNDVK